MDMKLSTLLQTSKREITEEWEMFNTCIHGKQKPPDNMKYSISTNMGGRNYWTDLEKPKKFTQTKVLLKKIYTQIL